MALGLIGSFIDIVLHLDVYLQTVIQTYSVWTYAFLFLIVFLETGIVVTPFLPGDSLLFAAGALAALGSLNVFWVFVLIFVAAVIGDAVNYHIGKYLGPKVFKSEKSWIFHREHLDRTQKFYEKYGGKTIILARFIPFVRTFAPFVAGIGSMSYSRFFTFNVIGAFLWCSLFVFGGYFFGNIPLVKENFEWVILGIIAISIIPLIKEFLVHRLSKNKAKQ